ncbi:MAG: GatB/YqeY domain-containing protein [Armatimonadota bacterium]|nr:GatB/YqeY domain-containing protein [Armatimonadota bacterium]MDR7520298.1 GatB/YqeY domain-containing protein [Armatimonadota bacterium]MDR7550378.1 GatB/YqeY domain-containing protein [Armatimonadota bacterium]
MTMAERLEADLKEALRAGDSLRTSTIRLARAAIKNAEIERRRALSDDEVVAILRHEVKRRREAIEGFERGGRDDLVQKEKLEMAILLGYLPPPLSDDEIRRLAAEVIADVGAAGERDVGRVMGPLMRRIAGRAEGKAVERIVREALRG